MAKAKTPEPEKSSVLPISSIVLEHHLKSLGESMRQWVKLKRVPPVLLLSGSRGIGKREIGYFLAQWILCENSGLVEAETSLFGNPSAEIAAPRDGDTPSPCGKCARCLKALHGSWVDFTEVLSEADEDADNKSNTLKIDQFRELKTKLGFGAHEGFYKFILIPDADRMTMQAANSMLKLLEEPPSGWVFVLTASDPTIILPTILSRCQTLKLKPFNGEEILALLTEAGTPAERKTLCAKIAQGSWKRAFALADDELWQRRKQILDFFESPQGALAGLIDWAAQGMAQFDSLVDQMELISLDLLQWSLQSQPADQYSWMNTDARKPIQAHLARLLKLDPSVESARKFWLKQSSRLAQVRLEVTAPLNRKNLIQDLLVPWL